MPIRSSLQLLAEKLAFRSRTVSVSFRLVIFLLATVAAIPVAQAQTFNVIYTFGTYGAHPQTGLTMDAAGNLYGTTSKITGNAGSVFRLSKRNSSWVFSQLYSFQGNSDGAAPDTRPVFGPNGLLIGATAEGGGPGCEGYGCGTVYTLTPPPHFAANVLNNWSENIRYRFTGGANGSAPFGDLIFDQAGNIYGVDGTGTTGWGAVYRMTPNNNHNWDLTVLYNFTGGSDGGGAYGIVFDNAGRLYGPTAAGGANGDGTIFRLTPSQGGWTEEALYNFQGASDGRTPAAGLIFDAAGNLYGTTLYGGSGGGGIVFELSPSGDTWTLTTLYSFTGPGGSSGILAMDAAGNLYGTTFSDGLYQQGNVFKLSPSNGGWIYTSLHDFTAGSDGANPAAGVVLDSAGNIYGTAENSDGQFGPGLVFEITP
ncbi:MAG: choice-of-anchor tandem repeat GloVer-containing protein [Candidatus Korobacteraceae bacterium]